MSDYTPCKPHGYPQGYCVPCNSPGWCARCGTTDYNHMVEDCDREDCSYGAWRRGIEPKQSQTEVAP